MAKKNINSTAVKKALKIGALAAVLGGGGILAHDRLTSGEKITDALGKSVGDTVDQVTGKKEEMERQAAQQRAYKNYADTHKQTVNDRNRLEQENNKSIPGRVDKAINTAKGEFNKAKYNLSGDAGAAVGTVKGEGKKFFHNAGEDLGKAAKYGKDEGKKFIHNAGEDLGKAAKYGKDEGTKFIHNAGEDVKKAVGKAKDEGTKFIHNVGEDVKRGRGELSKFWYNLFHRK
jgi:hypothetical protein